MNIHPIFVHFPIGLLVAYSVVEIAAHLSPALRRQQWLFSVRAFLLCAGLLGALVALTTGDEAQELIRHTNPRAFIIGTHSFFANATTVLYFIIAAAYIARIFELRGWGNRIVGTNAFFARIWRAKRYIAHLIIDTWLLPILALLALIGMTITGALGAAIVYGPDIDPFVSTVYHVFWPL